MSENGINTTRNHTIRRLRQNITASSPRSRRRRAEGRKATQGKKETAMRST
jgi:hypothetical protein